MPITTVTSDSFADATRLAALGVIAAHGAHGDTSVGDGLEMARTQLNALAAGSYDQKAMIVLTDGLENQPKWIADVGASIDNRTFAVGLGNESQVNTYALSQIAGSTGGKLLLAGLLTDSLDDQFRLRKFFLQILAGVTNTSIVKDPVGYVAPGVRIRVPFDLSEADINCRAILLTELPVVKLAVETPDGKIIDVANAASFGASFDRNNKIATSRFGLPVAFQAQKIHAGRWHALIELDREIVKRLLSVGVEATHVSAQNPIVQELATKGAKYCLSVHAFSNLRMQASVTQTGFVPGSILFLRAVLSEYGIPLAYRAQVTATIDYPDKTRGTVTLMESEPGVFTGALTATQSGVYTIRFVAEGGTSRGLPFTREELATAAVWTGGDRPIEPPPDPAGSDWCTLLGCLLSEKSITRELEERLKKVGLNLDGIRACVKRYCTRATRTVRG